MKYEIRKIGWMGETIAVESTDSKAEANGIATDWFINKDPYEDIHIYEEKNGIKVRIY